ncbi:Os02g0699150, partial [Oryza sativa Japonica Group]
GLELVVLGEPAVHDEVERAHGRQHPEEVVEVALVEVVGDPPVAARRRRERLHDGVDERAQVAPERDGEQRQRRARALHGVRRLAEEELQLRDVAEHLRAGEEEVLRHLPRDVDRLAARRGVEPLRLHERGHRHGERHEEAPGAHALQLRRLAGGSGGGEAPQRRHDHLAVEDHPCQDAENLEGA